MYCQNCGAPDKGGVFCTDCGGKDFADTIPANPAPAEADKAEPARPKVQAQQLPKSNPQGSSCASTLGGIAALLFFIGVLLSLFGL